MDKGIAATWAGGEFGIQVLLKFLPQAFEYLSDHGVMYILLIDENIPALTDLEDKFNWSVVVKKTTMGERQFVIRVTKKLN